MQSSSIRGNRGDRIEIYKGGTLSNCECVSVYDILDIVENSEETYFYLRDAYHNPKKFSYSDLGLDISLLTDNRLDRPRSAEERSLGDGQQSTFHKIIAKNKVKMNIIRHEETDEQSLNRLQGEFRLGVKPTVDDANKECEFGHLQTLIWLDEIGINPDHNGLKRAIHKGHINVIEWADELDLIDINGEYGCNKEYDWDDIIEDLATDDKNLPTLYWLATRIPEILISTRIVDRALSSNAIEILKWCYRFDPPIDSNDAESFDDAIENNCIDTIKFLLERDPQEYEGTELELGAAQHGHLELLELILIYYPDRATTKVADWAAIHGSINIIEYLASLSLYPSVGKIEVLRQDDNYSNIIEFIDNVQHQAMVKSANKR